MSHSIFWKLRGRISALGRAFVALVTMLAMLAPSLAWAGTPYSVSWAFTEEDAKCETAELGAENGDAFFSVNETPLATYEIPGALKAYDGSESNVAEAKFDSVLLLMGANDFHFETWN